MAPARPSSAGTLAGAHDFQGEEMLRPIISAQKGAHKTKNNIRHHDTGRHWSR